MSGGGTNTVSSQTIPSEILPYYQQALGQGSNLLNSGGPQYYPGQQVAPLNPLQEQGLTATQSGIPMAQQGYDQAQMNYQPTNMGLGSIMGAAMQPSASSSAQDMNRFETSGALMNPAMNPYLQGTFQQGANQVQNSLASQFGSAGRNIIGSAPIQSDELNNLATQLYGGAYNTGLQQTTQATGLAPSIDQGTYMPGNQLLNASSAALGNNAAVSAAGNNVLNSANNNLSVGAGLQGQTQNLINANQNQWNYNQQLPYNQLSWYSGLLGQNASPFRSGSSNVSGQGNPWSTAIGTGLLGSQLYGALGAGAGAAGLSAATIGAGTAAADAGIGTSLGTILSEAAPALFA
jgi:hypothetical protein